MRNVAPGYVASHATFDVYLNVISWEIENISESATFSRELQKDKGTRSIVVFRLGDIDKQSLASTLTHAIAFNLLTR